MHIDCRDLFLERQTIIQVASIEGDFNQADECGSVSWIEVTGACLEHFVQERNRETFFQGDKYSTWVPNLTYRYRKIGRYPAGAQLVLRCQESTEVPIRYSGARKVLDRYRGTVRCWRFEQWFCINM